jgi:apolipoprotein N-acyltransferase
LPMAGLLGRIGFTKLTEGEAGFSSGDGPHLYKVPGAPPVTPLICYEIIFPGAVTSGQRPGWLVNVTDDSWFGPWAGPMQHLLSARVRAIEEGLPIARAANTGISAMIDPYGRIVAHLGLGHMGIVDAHLPRALTPTPYARIGDWPFFLLLLAAAAVAFPKLGKWKSKTEN